KHRREHRAGLVRSPVFSCFFSDSSPISNTHLLVPAARFSRPGFSSLLRSPQSRGGRSAERRSGVCETPVGDERGCESSTIASSSSQKKYSLCSKKMPSSTLAGGCSVTVIPYALPRDR